MRCKGVAQRVQTLYLNSGGFENAVKTLAEIVRPRVAAVFVGDKGSILAEVELPAQLVYRVDCGAVQRHVALAGCCFELADLHLSATGELHTVAPGNLLHAALEVHHLFIEVDVAVEQDATGKAYDIALAYIAGIGGARAGILETTMDEETETDLFGEQTVLCGGVVDLMRCGFEVLVEAGYKPENAYFECIHEMKLIIDLVNKGGIAAMNYSISDTAEFGEYVSGPRVLPAEQVKANMRAVLKDIQDGTFAGKWIAENKNGRTFFNSKRAQLAKHPMEIVGKELREQMLWKNDSDLDTASN